MTTHNILVVEDDDSTRGLLLIVLKQAGFSADAVSSGREALKRLETISYSAVILDVVLPDISGLEVMRQMESRGRHSKCVVLMSAGTESLLDQAPPTLVHTKLRKPFNIKEVVAAVRGCIDSHNTGEAPFDNYPDKGRKE